MTTEQKVPTHIAIILDGNGRWAKKRRLPRALGHKQGCETLKNILDSCNDIGLNYLTVYAFSTENWRRSDDEVAALMQLIRYYIPRLEKKAMKKNTRVLIMGDRTRFAPDVIEILDSVENTTKENTGLTFILGLNYGGRAELTRAARLLAESIAAFNVRCVSGLRVNRDRMRENLHRSLMLVTALSPHIGYENAAKVAKKAYEEDLSLRDACVALGFLSAEQFDEVFHPEEMA